MAPVIARLKEVRHELETCVVVTAQHRAMLDQVLKVLSVEVDYDLDIMLPKQTLADITVRALSGIDSVRQQESPDIVLVQGDTTTALAGGLAAFYRQISVGHVEAGLRTHDKYNPFPEEMNRRLLDHSQTYVLLIPRPLNVLSCPKVSPLIAFLSAEIL